MREYVISVCFAILFCVGVFIVLPHKRYEGIVKIVCGIFVISTVASPIPGILKIGYEKFRLADYLNDENGFFEKVEESEKNYTQYMQDNFREIASGNLEKEIASVMEIDVRINIDTASGTVVAENVPTEYREKVEKYISTNYSLNTIFDS